MPATLPRCGQSAGRGLTKRASALPCLRSALHWPVWPPFADDATVIHVKDSVEQIDGTRIVRYHGDGSVPLAGDGSQDFHYLAAASTVQRRSRLVRQHQHGLIGQCARDGDALLLPAGETGRAVPCAMRRVEGGEECDRALLCFRRWNAINELRAAIIEARQQRQRSGPVLEGILLDAVPQMTLEGRRLDGFSANW